MPVADGAALGSVLIAGLVLYAGATRGFFVQDDFGWLESTRFTSISDYLRCFTRFNPALTYRPLSQETFFWLGQRLFGLWPAAFHCAAVSTHLVGTGLLYAVLRRFAPPLPSFVGALFYATHAAHVWAVYWISAFPEPLAFAFYAAAVLAFLEFDRTGSRRAYAASLLAMAGGIMSKESILSLPLVLAAYALCFARSRLAATLPFVAVSGGYVLARLTSAAVAAAPYPLVFGVETGHNLAHYLAWTGGFSETLLRARLGRDPEPSYGLLAAAVACVLVLLVALARERRVALFGLVWFAAALQPVLYFSQHIYPYYLAPALAGAALTLASALPAPERVSRRKALAVALGLGCLFVALGRATIRREGRWWTERTYEGRSFLTQLREIDGRVPPGRTVYVAGLDPDLLGVLQDDAALKAYGFSPPRFVLVALDARTPGHIRRLASTGEIRDFFAYACFEGVLYDWTELLRADVEQVLWLEGGLVEHPGVRLDVEPAEVHAGRDTIRLRLVNLRAEAIDVLYTLDGRLMPPLRGWALDADGSARVFVASDTPRGYYRYRGVRDARGPAAAGWIRVEQGVTVE
jgi:hypothetical protein